MSKRKFIYINTSCNDSKGVSTIRAKQILNFFKEKYSVTHLTPEKDFGINGITNIVLEQTNTSKESLISRVIRFHVSLHDKPAFETWSNQVSHYLETHQELLDESIVLINTHPFCLTRLAEKVKVLSPKTKVLVDMQDPYAFNPYRLTLSWLDSKMKAFEKERLKWVDGLVAITPSMKLVYQHAYPSIPVIFVPLAYQDQYVRYETTSSSDTSVFNIVYGGSLHGSRNLKPLLSLLKREQLVDRCNIVIIGATSLYTKAKYIFKKVTWKKPLDSKIYQEYLHNEAHVGLAIQGIPSKSAFLSAVAAKTYEYLASNKPIIFIGPKGDNTNLIKRFSKKYYCINPSDTKKTKHTLSVFLTKVKTTQNATDELFFTVFNEKNVYKRLESWIEAL